MTFVDNQVALLAGLGLCETGLEVLTISGPDAPSWLTTLSSQKVADMTAGLNLLDSVIRAYPETVIATETVATRHTTPRLE